MLNQLNRLIISGIIFVSLCFSFISIQPAYSKTNGIPIVADENTQELTIDVNNTRVKDLDIDPINTDGVKKDVIPDTKKESKKLIGLFIKMMFLVTFSAIVISVILFFVKRFNASSFVPSDEEYENAEMLELITPQSKTDALKSFLNRTK